MSSNKEIKDQLLYILDKIDEAIQQYRQSKYKETQSKQQEDLLKESCPKNITKINSLKSQIETLQINLEDVYNIEKINQLESAIKKKEKTLKELKNERYTLNNVLKEQNKGINEYLLKFDTTKELKQLSDQVKMVKENYHNYKETYKQVYNKIKSQKNRIDELEKRCLIIKQNIEYHKKKQLKEVQKKEKAEEYEFDGEDLAKMEEIEKNLIEQINSEEKNFRIEINEQNDIIRNINDQIIKIDMKIKSLVQEKKMDKILEKNRKRGKSLTSYHKNSKSKTKSNTNIIKNIPPNRRLKKRLSNNNHSPSSNYVSILKNNVIKNKKRNMLRTANYVVTKPFEIKKFNDFSNNLGRDNNDEKNNTVSNDNRKLKLSSFGNNGKTGNINNYEKIIKKKNVKGMSTLKEIEMLKNEIQFALINNIVLLDSKGNIIKNETDLNDKKKIPSNKAGGFLNSVNDTSKQKEKEEDSRSDFYGNKNNVKKTILAQNEKRINDYLLNMNEKSKEKNNKRKPFDKIIFKQ
jgi:hypothetical protein